MTSSVLPCRLCLPRIWKSQPLKYCRGLLIFASTTWSHWKTYRGFICLTRHVIYKRTSCLQTKQWGIFLRWNLSSLSQLTDPPFYKHTLHACRFRTLIVIITSFLFKLVRRGISSPRSIEKRLWEATPSLLENVSSCTLPPFCHNYFVWGGAYCLLTIIFLAYWMTVATLLIYNSC